MNAPMVPPEVLAELQPYVALAQGLARAAVQLVSTAAHGFSDIYISYASSRGDDLDTRLLRAMVIKGILEQARPAVSLLKLLPMYGSRTLQRPDCLLAAYTHHRA